jgi:RNA polymerase sigma factor (sigma-70 family)
VPSLDSAASDEAIVAAVAAGDQTAFTVLVRRHTAIVRAVVADQLRNRDDVAEVVQEVFVRALEKLPTLNDPSRLRPWLLSIARNAAVDRRRSNQRRAHASTDELELDPASDGPGPDVVAELRDLVADVKTGIGRLSQRDATLLAMVTYLGFTPTEVSGVLGMTPGAAKVALHRARQRLRHALVAEAALRTEVSGCARFHDAYENLGVDAAVAHAIGCERCHLAHQAVLAGSGPGD